MSRERVALFLAPVSILLLMSCGVGQAPRPENKPADTQQAAASELHANTVKEFKFPGGIYADGRIKVAPGYKTEKGPEKNTIMLRANDNNVKINCWCTLEGGDCWTLDSPTPDGGVEVGCVGVNCASGKEPFCFMDIITDNPLGFNIRLAVASRQQ